MRWEPVRYHMLSHHTRAVQWTFTFEVHLRCITFNILILLRLRHWNLLTPLILWCTYTVWSVEELLKYCSFLEFFRIFCHRKCKDMNTTHLQGNTTCLHNEVIHRQFYTISWKGKYFTINICTYGKEHCGRVGIDLWSQRSRVQIPAQGDSAYSLFCVRTSRCNSSPSGSKT